MGLSDKVGPLDYSSGGDEPFLGYSMGHQKAISDDKAALIDSEVQRIVEDGYKRAKKILTEKLDDLHTLAKALLEYEMLSGDEIKALLRGEKPKRDEPEDRPKEPEIKKPKSSVPSGGRKKKGDVGGGSGEIPQGA